MKMKQNKMLETETITATFFDKFEFDLSLQTRNPEILIG